MRTENRNSASYADQSNNCSVSECEPDVKNESGEHRGTPRCPNLLRTYGIGLLPQMNVEQNVEVIPRLLGWASKKKERTEELLTLVGLQP